MQSRSSSHRLQSTALTVEVRPEEGGRVASLKSRLSGLEFLTASRRGGPFPPPSLDANFADGFCAGIEECLPTIAPCDAATAGGAVPDHGDFWQIPWRVTHADARKLAMCADGFSRSLRFCKTVSVGSDALRLDCEISNTGITAQSFLYACHPLFAVEEGDRIVLPPGIHDLRLDYSRHGRLGARGQPMRWPEHGGRCLDRALAVDAGTAEMFYTGRLGAGRPSASRCGILRRATGQTLELRFDVDSLPYLGVWLCYGGWPDDRDSANPQYAVALEPTTAPFNSLSEAHGAGAAAILPPGASFRFWMEFRVVEAKVADEGRG